MTTPPPITPQANEKIVVDRGSSRGQITLNAHSWYKDADGSMAVFGWRTVGGEQVNVCVAEYPAGSWYEVRRFKAAAPSAT